MKFLRYSVFTFIFSFIWFASHSVAQIQKEQKTKDLKEDWLIYDKSQQTYVPYILNTPFNSPTASFLLSFDAYRGKVLYMQLQKGTSVLFDQKILDHTSQAEIKYYKVDSLRQLFNNDSVFVTLYNSELNSNVIETYIVNPFPSESVSSLKTTFEILKRWRPTINDFFVAGLFLLLIFYAILYNVYPKIFREFYNAGKAFAINVREQGAFVQKPFDSTHLPFYLFHSFVVSFVVIIAYNYIEPVKNSLQFLRYSSFAGALIDWLMFGLVIFCSILLKYMLINFLSSIFSLKKFSQQHFLDFTRMSMIFFLTLFFVGSSLMLGFKLRIQNFDFLIYIIIGFSAIRIIILFFKLLRFASFNNLHLFSYLCTTEVIPVLIGIKILLNK